MAKQTSNALIITFLALTTISAISLIGPTLNYIEFYTALEKLDLLVSSLSWRYVVVQQKVDVTANFTVENPTSYTGFRLRSIQVMGIATLFAESNKPVDLDDGISVWYMDPAIYPNSNMTLPIILHIEGVNAQNFLTNLEDHNGNIQWKFTCRLIVGTFMGDIPIWYYPAFP